MGLARLLAFSIVPWTPESEVEFGSVNALKTLKLELTGVGGALLLCGAPVWVDVKLSFSVYRICTEHACLHRMSGAFISVNMPIELM